MIFQKIKKDERGVQDDQASTDEPLKIKKFKEFFNSDPQGAPVIAETLNAQNSKNVRPPK